MIGYVSVLGQIPLRRSGLGQLSHYDPDYPYRKGYEPFRHYNVPDGPFDVEAIAVREFDDRWEAALTKRIATLYSLSAIPTDAWPPKGSYTRDEHLNSFFDPEQWVYRSDGIVYVFGEPLDHLKRYEEGADQGREVVSRAVDEYITNLDKVNDLLKEIDGYLGEGRLSKEEADWLRATLETCRKQGTNPEAVACLEGLLSDIKRAVGGSQIPTAVYIFGGLAAAGVVGYLAFGR